MVESKKITLSLGAKKKPQSLSTPLNGTKRPHSALHDSDNEDDAEGKHEEVTHFDLSAGGAVHTDKKVAPKQLLVIPLSEHSKKRQRSGLPTQDTEAAEAAVAEAKAKAAPIQFGLNVGARSAEDVEVAPKNEPPTEQVGFKKRTVEEEALDSLLGKGPSSNAIIPALTDQQTFERDYDEAPDVPTEADYDAVPIEEFGAAMLRGMGWKDGDAIGKKRGQKPVVQRVIERRADLLGVGAKPAKALGIELGEWGKHANKHERAINKAYAPVVLKNKKTGELVTEEELKAKLKEQEEQAFVMVEEDLKTERRLEYRSSKSSRRDEYDDHSRDDRDKEKRRDRERDHGRIRDRDERKHKPSRRERSASVDSHRRRKDDDSEDAHRIRKRKDKERRHRDRSSSPESRHRSRYDDKPQRDTKSRDEPRSHHKDRSDRDRRR
ncbi:putative pre-mrna-splicing factor spp2 protein [Venturia nashicola]|nr:putative pre-mrna-splicing factor spp2 protein [Venturia nashicola]